MKILVIDNYDSFTYNLVQYLNELGAGTLVYRNDKLSLKTAGRLKFSRVVISPGPGRPEDAGVSCEVIGRFYKKMPILGVCLGHQCIGEYFGGRITKAAEIMHGKTSLIHHNNKGIFVKVKNPFVATRYHSLAIDSQSLPGNLTVTARTNDGIIMGIKMNRFPLYGVQFHPESILTVEGKKILKNFIECDD